MADRNGSYRREGKADRHRSRLFVLQPFGEHAKGERLRLDHGGGARPCYPDRRFPRQPIRFNPSAIDVAANPPGLSPQRGRGRQDAVIGEAPEPPRRRPRGHVGSPHLFAGKGAMRGRAISRPGSCDTASRPIAQRDRNFCFVKNTKSAILFVEGFHDTGLTTGGVDSGVRKGNTLWQPSASHRRLK
jgi:hypothetical protein